MGSRDSRELRDYEIKLEEARQKINSVLERPVMELPGIYVFWRVDSDGIRYAYVGQAKHLLTRLAQHLLGCDSHIDLSLKNRKLYDKNTSFGEWHIHTTYCDASELDFKEHSMIVTVAKSGMQLYNIQSGGGLGRRNIQSGKPPKTYRDGLKQGYLNARREVAKLFKANLIVSINGKETVNKQKSLEKFFDFLHYEEGENYDNTTD